MLGVCIQGERFYPINVVYEELPFFAKLLIIIALGVKRTDTL